ncbi:MAG: class I SAM-dependent methyltransferase [Verrucomicrobiota bacterium]
MTRREPFTGVLRVVRFNWPFYATAPVVAVSGCGTLAFSNDLPIRIAALVALLGSTWFLVGSLTASHLVYDRSDLHRGEWLARAFPEPPDSIALCHCGFDEISSVVRSRFPASQWTVFDHYDEAIVDEPSIRRARRLFPPARGTRPVPHSAWPAAGGTFDAIVGALALHELRTDVARAAWFSEAKRCLSPTGRLVLVEHIRDVPNFAAFGPGFLHFHSAATWQRAWERAGLFCADTFCITPFVRVFVLRHHD